MRMNEVHPFTKVSKTRSQYVRLDTLLSNGGVVWKHRLLWSDTISGQTVTEDYPPACLDEAKQMFVQAVKNA